MRIANIIPLFTLTLAACAVDADDDADGREPLLIASVDRPSGSHVEFLTTEGGLVMVTEDWQVENRPTLSPEMVRAVDPRDYYRALTGEEAPDDLAAAVEASGVPYRRFAPSELTLADGPRPSSFWAVGPTAAQFEAAMCGLDYGSRVEDWCDLDEVVETKHKKYDIKGLQGSVCTVTGEVKFEVSIREWGEWERKHWMLPAGYCKQHNVISTRWDFDGESRVQEVGAGDKYHHAGMRCWNSGSLTCPVISPEFPDDWD